MRKYVGETFDLNELYVELYGYVAPTFSLGDRETDNALEESYKKTVIGTEMIMPVSLGIPSKPLWDIPTEPMVSLKGGHKIIRRFPNRSAKGGSIKERWSSEDYKVTIKGALIDFNENKYPESQVKRLREICEYKGSLKVSNTLFRLFGIERIALTEYDIPFTQGLPVQGYTLQGYSDELFDALLTER